MRFKPGQEVVSIVNWKSTVNGQSVVTPKKNEIVTVVRYANQDYIHIKEYPISTEGIPATFLEVGFEPLADITELNEILNSVGYGTI